MSAKPYSFSYKMKLVILEDVEKVAEWSANYVIEKINNFQVAHPQQYFVIGLPTGRRTVVITKLLSVFCLFITQFLCAIATGFLYCFRSISDYKPSIKSQSKPLIHYLSLYTIIYEYIICSCN